MEISRDRNVHLPVYIRVDSEKELQYLSDIVDTARLQITIGNDIEFGNFMANFQEGIYKFMEKGEQDAR